MASRALSLLSRDSFFSDDFFKDSWTDFDSAIQQVLDKWDNKGLKVSSSNRVDSHNAYRLIRKTKINDDIYAAQALNVVEKDGNFQCVMDVKDFDPGDLKVRVVENRVIVEGKYEKVSEDGSSKSSKQFYKEFTLPDSADLDLTATALSKDGILTICSPKREGGGPQSGGSKLSSSSTASMQQSSSSSFSSAGNSSIKSSSTSSSSFSSSSSSKSVVQSSSSATSKSLLSGGAEPMLEDAANDPDRILFTHDTVNLKLPGGK